MADLDGASHVTVILSNSKCMVTRALLSARDVASLATPYRE
jgi:hypothetical protein